MRVRITTNCESTHIQLKRSSTSRALLPLISLFTLVLPACSSGQYLAIPGAVVLTEDWVSPAGVSTQAATVSVTSGNPALVAGDSVTLNVDFTSITEFPVTVVLFWTPEMEQLWEYDVSDDEALAGSVQIEFQALAEKPSEDSCYIPYHQQGWCAQPAESGVTQTMMWTQGTDSSSPGMFVPVTMAPETTGTDACAGFTIDDCCFTSGGIQSEGCNIVDCSCPDGTTDAGVQGDGTTLCMCPA
jgi:hypothetical protein